MNLYVVGCGDAFGSGGQFQSCFLINDAHGAMAVDFGATSLVALRAAGLDPQMIDHIVLTHFHGDHIGGLPFFLLDREYSARVCTPLRILGPRGLSERLQSLMECMFPGAWKENWRFPLELIEIEPDLPLQIGERRILSKKVQHPTGPYDATALRIETCDRVIAFSGDTGWVDGLYEISAGSDLFICECFDIEEQPYEGHLSLPVLLSKLPDVHSQRILLNHLGPEMLSNRSTIPYEQLSDGATYSI
ncbi:MBL fold metallo-hydrolase [Puniceibacterium sediminis]|uniref:MBL fold metallo-hydrolase n=1 Tax=Puniceibacterium sediminis TaxID=1608407 RepID=UPI00318400C3